MDGIKGYLLDIGLKTLGPSAVRGAILGLSAWLLARNGALAHYGVISDAATHTLTIHWDTVSTALIALLPAALAVVLKLLSHHGAEAVSSLTQNGGTK